MLVVDPDGILGTGERLRGMAGHRVHDGREKEGISALRGKETVCTVHADEAFVVTSP